MTEENKDEKKDEKKVEGKPGKIVLEKNEIRVLCTCCKDVITSTKGMDLEKDKSIFLDKGEGKGRWCKHLTTWPEIQARIFE